MARSLIPRPLSPGPAPGARERSLVLSTYYNLFPSPRLFIVINNTSLHYSKEIIDLYNKVSVIIKYLPPYSPSFNRIKIFFLVIKSKIKRYYSLFKDITFNTFL